MNGAQEFDDSFVPDPLDPSEDLLLQISANFSDTQERTLAHLF